MSVPLVEAGVAKGGTTAQRPTNASLGATYYDTDTAKLIANDGTAWVSPDSGAEAPTSITGGATPFPIAGKAAASATAAGGAITITAAAGGSTSGTGGAVSVTGGAGTAGNANGGAVTIKGGAKHGSGANGALNLGSATTDLVGFHGSTAVVQRAGAAQAAVAADAATNSSPYGYSQSQADAIVTLLNEIRAALVEKGIIKGAA